MENISIIGTGLMGYPMAKNILKGGFDLIAYNRTLDKAKGLSKDGAKLASSIKEAVENSKIILTMLSDDEAVISVISSKDFLENIKAESIVVDMSSTKPTTSKKIYEILKKKDVHFLDAPVSGGTVGAENGTLAIMVGGDELIFKKVIDLFKTMGNSTFVGPVGSGQIAKLANQIIVGVTIGAVAEAMHLCKKAGADPSKFIKAVEGGFADSRLLKNHGKKMIDNDFKPGGKTSTHLKDMNNILESANDFNFKLPISKLIKDMYQELVNNGHSEKDHSSLYLQIEEMNKNG